MALTVLDDTLIGAVALMAASLALLVRRMRHLQKLNAVLAESFEQELEGVALTSEDRRVAGFLQDITGLKRAQERLQRSFTELRALTAQLQGVREEERARLARELHDELGQALTAIKIDLASLQVLALSGPSPGGVPSRIGPIMSSVDHAIHSVRRISTELRPSILDDLGLVAAVEWMSEDFERRTGICCQVSLPAAPPPIDPERATALFRILQETLTNVSRHAAATRVSISLMLQNAGLLLKVHDNGCGIGANQTSANGSLGILGMRERALLLGGGLDVTGGPEGGTTVSVRIPWNGRVSAAVDH